MPSLAKVITYDDLPSRHAYVAGAMLGSSLDIIDTIVRDGGVGGCVALEPSESRRTAKRRLSMAAKVRGHTLAWRSSHDANTVRFVLDGADARKRPIRIVPERELVAV